MINQVVGMESVIDSIFYADPSEYVSECCGAKLLPESDICSLWYEHSEPMKYDEWFGDTQDVEPLVQNASEFKNVTMNGEKIKWVF